MSGRGRQIHNCGGVHIYRNICCEGQLMVVSVLSVTALYICPIVLLLSRYNRPTTMLTSTNIFSYTASHIIISGEFTQSVCFISTSYE